MNGQDKAKELPELPDDQVQGKIDELAEMIQNQVDIMGSSANQAWEDFGVAKEHGPTTIAKIKEGLKARGLDVDAKPAERKKGRGAEKREKGPGRAFKLVQTKDGYKVVDHVIDIKTEDGKETTVEKDYPTDIVIPPHLLEALPKTEGLEDRVLRQCEAVRNQLKRKEKLDLVVPDQAGGRKMPVWVYTYKEESLVDELTMAELPKEIRRERSNEARIDAMVAFVASEEGKKWMKRARPNKIYSIITKILEGFVIDRPEKRSVKEKTEPAASAVADAPAQVEAPAPAAAPAPTVEPRVEPAPPAVEAESAAMKKLREMMARQRRELEVLRTEAEGHKKEIDELKKSMAQAGEEEGYEIVEAAPEAPKADAAAIKAELEALADAGGLRDKLRESYSFLKLAENRSVLEELVRLQTAVAVREQLEKRLADAGLTHVEIRAELKKLGYEF